MKRNSSTILTYRGKLFQNTLADRGQLELGENIWFSCDQTSHAAGILSTISDNTAKSSFPDKVFYAVASL